MERPTVEWSPTRRRVLRSSAALGALSLGADRVAGDDARANQTQIAAADDRHPRGTSVTERFDDVVDLRRAGADPTGSRPIDDVLRANVRDDTLVVLPSGTYRVEKIDFYAVSNWGLVGVGDVTIVPTGTHDGVFAAGHESDNVWLDGFTLDVTDAASATVSVVGYGDVAVRNITVTGRYTDSSGPAFVFRPLGSDATHRVENVVATDGGNCVALYADHDQGRVEVRDCRFEEFWNNGVYASSATGSLLVDGGTYRNNNVANVRVGSSDTTVRNVRIVVDSIPDHWTMSGRDMRGIRVVDGPATGTVTVENCDLEFTGGCGSGAFVSEPTAGDYAVRNTRIRVDDGYAVGPNDSRSSFAVSAYGDGEMDSHQRFENVSITGNAREFLAARFQRGNTTLKNVCVQQPNRNGVDFQHGGGNVVADSTVNVGGRYAVDGPASVTNLSKGGSCPVPGGATASTASTASDVSSEEAIPGAVQAEDYDVFDDYHGGVDTERGGTRDGTPNVGWTRNGEWLKFDVDSTPGTYDVVADVAGTGSPGRIHLTLNGGYVATIDVPDTGGWHDWQLVTVPDVDVPTDDENATLRVTFDGGDTNLNRIAFR